MTPEQRANHCYLGDGVYAEFDGYHIILRTSDHRDELCDNKIYLDDNVLHSLKMFQEHLIILREQKLRIINDNH